MPTMQEIRATAKQRMEGFCRVCPVCNGKACVGEVPGMGGLGTGQSFIANVESLARIKLAMRCIHGVAEPDTSCEILGLKLDLPVLAAPIGGVSFNMGGKISEEDYCRAVLQGSKDAGTIGCTGDGVPPFIHETANQAIAELGGHGIPFVKPWDSDELFEKLEKAAATGASVAGMDVDACGLITLKLMGRPVAPKSLDKLREIVAATEMRFIVKGIMTPEDARLAMEAGADAIVVSNHGGRVLDHTPGTAEALPAVAREVKGRLTILADGGVRTGSDVLKMLALGADAVLVGRPVSIAAIGGLAEGVTALFQQMKTELAQAMVLTGCPSVASAGPQILWRD